MGRNCTKFTWSTHRKTFSNTTYARGVCYTNAHVRVRIALWATLFALKIQDGAESGEFWAKSCGRNTSFGH